MKCPICERILGIEEPVEIPSDKMEYHVIILINQDHHMEIHAPIDSPEIMKLILNGIGSVMQWKINILPIEKGISQ